MSGAAPRASDAVVVLAGGDLSRPREAADLYRDGLTPYVIVTRELPPGGVRVFEEISGKGIRLHESYENYVQILLGYGVPEGRIIRVDEFANDTLDELQKVRAQVRERRWKSLTIVTSKYHTRRTALAARYVFEPEIETIVVASRHDPYDPNTWWMSRGMTRTFIIEFEKLVAYSIDLYPRILLGLRG